MNGNLQLEQALLTESLSGFCPANKSNRAASTLAGSFYIASCVVAVVSFGDDFTRPCGNPIHQPQQRDCLAMHKTNGIDFSPAKPEDVGAALPNSRRVRLPLIRSLRPGTVELTNAQIEELLD